MMAKAGELRPMCVTGFGYSAPIHGRLLPGFAWVLKHTPRW